MFFPKIKLIAILSVVFLVFFIFLVSSQSFTANTRTLFVDLNKLPLVLVSFLSHEARAVAFFHKSYWQNKKLMVENEALKAQILRHKDEEAENARLRQLLDLKTRSSYHTIAARVIGKDFYSLRSYLIIDKGRMSGVKKYAPVMTPSGLVGKIFEVGLYSSKVILINDPDLSVPAMNGRTREHGLVSGTLDGKSKLRYLDLESDIKVKDEVITSGLNMSYPEGILIGVVKAVASESSGLGKFAIFEPAVKISSLDEVLVVTP